MIVFHAGIPVVAFLAYASLLYFLYRSGITPGPRRILGVFLVANCLAALSSFTLHTNLLVNPTASLWALVISGFFIYASMLHFAIRFPYTKARTKWLVPLVYCFIPVILIPSFITGLTIQDVKYLGDGFIHIQFGPLMNVVFLYLLAAGVLAVTFLVASLRRVREQIGKRRIQFTLAANICLVVGGLMNAVPSLSNYPIDILSQVISAVLLTYAILRHSLLDIGVVLREGVARALTLFIALLLYLGLLLGFVFIPQVANRGLYAAGGMVAAILIAWLYYRFGDAINRIVRAKIINVRYERSQVMEDATQFFSRVREPVDVSNVLIELIATNMGCSKAALWLSRRETDTYLLNSYKGFRVTQCMETSFDGGHPFIAKMKHQGDVMNPTEMQEFRSLLTSLAIDNSVLDMLDANVAVPLHGSDQMLGFIILGPKENGFYSQEDLTLLGSLRYQAGIALENVQFHQRLRSLASQLSLAEEQERKHLATALHDQISQALAVINIKLGVLREPLSSVGFDEQVDEIRSLVNQTIQDTRSLTFELSPPVLYELGLEAALDWLTEQVQQEHGIQCTFEDDGQTKPLGDDARGFLFWAVRELLMNVIKHASAQAVTVSVCRDDGQLRVVVEDNGVGFNTSEMERRTRGFGLFSIQERLTEFGGQFELDSMPGRRTRCTLAVPLEQS